MTKFKDIINELEKHFNPNLQENYDNAGIQLDAGVEEITGCLITLDITEKVVDEAIFKKCNLIVSHHPLIFGKGLMKITDSTATERILKKCIINSISIYTSHTNCDNSPGGTSAVMAAALGLQHVQTLLPDKEIIADDKIIKCGSGAIGDLPVAIATEDFLRRLKKCFECGAVRYSEIIKSEVKRIAICPGSGSFLLSRAIEQGADVFISGDFTYHKFFEADSKIIIADIGHYESECGIKHVFSTILEKKFVNFVVKISEENTNPIKYL